MMTDISIILIGIALFLAYRGLIALANALLDKLVNICASTMIIYNITRIFI